MNYLVTIGLETHVQLKTATKMFCGCETSFGAPPNTHVCPVCLGYPGALPHMNREAIRLTVRAGLMLGCRINPYSKFDRKNYFYPDMAKNYQISQLDRPLCLGGSVEIQTPAGPKTIRLTRIHLEEDVAKLTHHPGASGVDFNRAGTPLMEIVSEPDLASPDEAFAYLQALRETLVYAGVSDCNLEEGNLRCDVNVSIRPEGQQELGVKVEMKNLNTFKGVHAALVYEIDRQKAALDAGETIKQQTRRWDAELCETFLMRLKENADDYRYFPEPDLLPVELSQETIDSWARDLPEPPAKKRARFVTELKLPEYDAGVLSADRALSDYFEATAAACGNPKAASNWIMTELLRHLSATGKTIADVPLSPQNFGALIKLVEGRTINGPTAKELLPELLESGGDPEVIVKTRGLAQVTDTAAIEALVDQVIAANPKVVADYQAGKKASAGFLVGQVMKLSKGKADPKLAGSLVATKLAAH
ncbi:MAG: Asp-tRNA(Asn)/Glu-tRNA(Gln) amidotransferase subunit GatB [Kiritimatiellia bacterium]